MTFYAAYAIILTMDSERLPETSFAKKETKENGSRKLVEMAVMGAAGLAMGLTFHPYESGPDTSTSNNPAAVAEQNAVDFVNAVHENPSVLDDKDTSTVTLEDGDSVNSATQRAAKEVGEREGWSSDQENLNIGVIAKASQEVRHTNSEKTGTAYNISKVGDTVTVVREDVNGDGTKEFFPVDVQSK